MKKINWRRVWAAFSRWHNKTGASWENQQKKIQALVNAQLRSRKDSSER